MKKKPRVLMAMSGGVDSSAAASILVEEGYDVVGVTMQVWDYSASSCDIEEGHGTCCSSLDVEDARSVADHLKIPFYVMNCEAPFKTHVIDDFTRSYLEGRTPIPCVNCNTYLKFDHLFDKMKELECDHLATGHYARLEKDSSGHVILKTSSDDWKDQTYFLFTLKPERLSSFLFPIGHMNKADVRAYAERKGLLIAHKKDSQGLCFVGKEGYSHFLENNISKDLIKKGPVKLYPTGEILAQHEGIHLFTYGQRRGLGVSYKEPLYVVKIDPQTHTVWLGTEESLYARSLEVHKVNLLDDVKEGEKLRVKIRFMHKGSEAQITGRKKDKLTFEFKDPQRSITPGQAAVFYRGDQLVGGGWIA